MNHKGTKAQRFTKKFFMLLNGALGHGGLILARFLMQIGLINFTEMPNLKGAETEVLINMLARQTELLTTKIAEKNSAEIRQLEYDIAMIQAELNSRKPGSVDTSIIHHKPGITPGTT